MAARRGPRPYQRAVRAAAGCGTFARRLPMTTHATRTGLQLQSLVRANGQLELSLVSIPVPDPSPDEVLVRIEASPLNPSDLRLLFGGADMSTAVYSGTATHPVVTATIPPDRMRDVAGRRSEERRVGKECRSRR